MKTSKLILTLASVALLSGCAKEFKANEGEQAAAVVNPTFPADAPPGLGAGSAGDSWAYGATGDFTPDSLAVMNMYVGRQLSAPTNIKINVNVYDVGGGHFGGQVKMSYDDAGVHREGYFVAGTGVNQYFPSYGTAKDVGLYQAQYNTWLNSTQFSGYFQDSVGAIVLVVDGQGPSLGDGQANPTVTGSVWFKNFNKTVFSPDQGSERFCWFIYAGPYQCGSTFLNVKLTPYPMDTYTKLGTFTGLTRAKAFNQ